MNTGYPEELLAELADFTARHTTKPSTGPAGSPPLPGPVEPHAYTAGVEQWRSLVATYFPAEQVDRALRIMSCESAGDPNAYNRSGASGLFQHMARYWAERSAAAGWAGADIFDPTANVAVAAWLSKGGSDWSDWACSP
jgi:soluble lytic murein transglycosylase-like protein